jgi:MFS family permease
MPESSTPALTLQSRRFLCLYGLAVAGGSVAYVPFLTLLLPLQVSKLAGHHALSVLAYTSFAGAIAASIANIGFGWASDVSRTRRPWIALGMILSSVLLLAMQFSVNPSMLVALIVCWQLCLNMMLAPLNAWAGDCVPDAQKGLLGGLLAFAPALGALSGAFITLHGFAGPVARLNWVAALVIAMVCPVLICGRPKHMPHLMFDDTDTHQSARKGRALNTAVARMWLARLLVQIAEASLFAFLLLWFRSIDPSYNENLVASIFTAVLVIAVLIAIFAGRWSDRVNKPIVPIALCAGTAAIGLFVMSIVNSLPGAIAGYAIFGLASSVFLALHSSQTLGVLVEPRTRGRSLGLFNLTNTIPSLIMPWLTLALVPLYGFDALFLLQAGLAAIACLLLLTVPRQI